MLNNYILPKPSPQAVVSHYWAKPSSRTRLKADVRRLYTDAGKALYSKICFSRIPIDDDLLVTLRPETHL